MVPIADTEKLLEVDTVCVAFGFVPSLQLPRLLGCRIRRDRQLSAWITEHDADQRTSVERVFVAGETTGIGGHDVAMAEGALASAGAAADLGFQPREGVEKQPSKIGEELSRHRQFADFLNRTFALKPGLYEIIEGFDLLLAPDAPSELQEGGGS